MCVMESATKFVYAHELSKNKSHKLLNRKLIKRMSYSEHSDGIFLDMNNADIKTES